jgi:hypothetical protein
LDQKNLATLDGRAFSLRLSFIKSPPLPHSYRKNVKAIFHFWCSSIGKKAERKFFGHEAAPFQQIMTIHKL